MKRSTTPEPEPADLSPAVHRYAPEGRAEFARLYVDSLTATTESEVSIRSWPGRWFARRRLDTLRAYEVERHRPLVAVPLRPPKLAFAVVSVVWLGAAAALAVAVAADAHTAVQSAADLAMLVVSLAWFLVALLCVPTTARAFERSDED
jgi:hypothetical protein